MSPGHAGDLPSPSRRRVPGNAVFFPAAAVYATLVLPASVLSMLGMIGAFPGIATPSGHAHEMLFGFALAVVAGNQLGPRAPRTLAALVALWLVARIAFLLSPEGYVSVAANIGFPALLAWQLAPRLFGSAKKWRNQALPIVLAAICGCAVAFTLAPRAIAASSALQRPAYPWLIVAVSLFSLLLLFMGGRLIAPSVAGQLHRQGVELRTRVQPRIEGALIILMVIATVALAVEATGHGAGAWAGAAGAALAASGLLAALRLARWRLWALRGRRDLVCLGAGYAWLALGLIMLGLAHSGVGMARSDATAALHVITIGSLGTLTLNVMAMTGLLKARRSPAITPLPMIGTLLLAMATLLRVLAGYGPPNVPMMLLLASLCWSGAFGLLLIVLLRVAPGPHRSQD